MNYLKTLFATFILCAVPAAAELRVDITQGTFNPIPIAVPHFEYTGSTSFFSSNGPSNFAKDIPDIVLADLESSGLFRGLDRAAFIQGQGRYLVSPNFQDWRLIKSDALVTGRVTDLGGNTFSIEFRLFDVYSERQMDGVSMTASYDDWRRVAHKIADKIYERITGEKGYFDTQIMYVAENGAGDRRQTRLAIMDQDGANHSYITNGNRLVMSPRFSPNMSQVVFMDYGQDRKTPRVHVLDLKQKVQRQLGTFKSMTFAPRFMPDAETVLMSISEGPNSALFKMNIRTQRLTRLSKGPWIDTSPCASPNGRQIVFNSDRGGRPHLYVMDYDGSNAKRISFGGGRYATPVWSPRGDLIAFTKIEGGEFFIGVMRPDGSGERLLARGYLVEEPSWSPNGRMVVYTKQSYPVNGQQPKARLYKIDVTGHFETEVPTPGQENAVSAAWSPLIH